MDSLSTCDAGITINNVKYNVFCYADDLLLTSTTITGLQTLIDLAVSHVTQRGLQFNPVKTVCMSSSQHSFVDEPRWTINGTILNNDSDIKYLGTTLAKNCGSFHIKSRINSANRAFYSLQGAGLYYHGISPRLAAYIYNTAIRSGLVYGCHTIHLSQLDLIKLNKAQAKYVRTVLGLRSYCYAKPVLQALGIKQISDSVALACIDLLQDNLRSNSSTSGVFIIPWYPG